jgi:hypothetical protein
MIRSIAIRGVGPKKAATTCARITGSVSYMDSVSRFKPS